MFFQSSYSSHTPKILFHTVPSLLCHQSRLMDKLNMKFLLYCTIDSSIKSYSTLWNGLAMRALPSIAPGSLLTTWLILLTMSAPSTNNIHSSCTLLNLVIPMILTLCPFLSSPCSLIHTPFIAHH